MPFIDGTHGSLTGSATIKLSPEQDTAVSSYIDSEKAARSDYHFHENNCVIFAQDALRAGGIDPYSIVNVPILPKDFVNRLNERYNQPSKNDPDGFFW